MTTDVSTHTRTDRAELIADLRAFADMLERFPNLPVGMGVLMQYTVLDGDEETRVKEVRRVAAMLGVEAEFHKNGKGIAAHLPLGRAEYVVYTSLGGGA